MEKLFGRRDGCADGWWDVIWLVTLFGFGGLISAADDSLTRMDAVLVI